MDGLVICNSTTPWFLKYRRKALLKVIEDGFILLGQLKLSSQNKPVLELLIHDIPLRNIVEPLNVCLNSVKFRDLTMTGVYICNMYAVNLHLWSKSDIQQSFQVRLRQKGVFKINIYGMAVGSGNVQD